MRCSKQHTQALGVVTDLSQGWHLEAVSEVGFEECVGVHGQSEVRACPGEGITWNNKEGHGPEPRSESSKGLTLGSDGKPAGTEVEMAAWTRVEKGLTCHAEEFKF